MPPRKDGTPNTGLDGYTQWDRLAESVASEAEEPNLTPDQRSKALRAIGFLRRRFGEHWLGQVFDEAHPFMDLVWNRAPWTRVRIADLVDAIKQVELLPDGKALIDRYAQSDQESYALLATNQPQERFSGKRQDEA
jgi:hypothetical protein